MSLPLLPSVAAKPAVVCLGMGVAVLASASISRSTPHLWRALRRVKYSTAAAPSAWRDRLGLALETPATAELGTAQYLQCVHELEHVDSARLSKQKITVVQYNILASNLASRNHFPYVVESSLNWEYRKMTLLRQLEELDADVVCLEELSDYWTFFKPELYLRGYDSVYVKRPSINVSTWSGDKKHDGCGIFYKKDKFELKECETINFHDPHDRVAIMALLKMRHFAQFVLVGCTHLWWNAKKVDHQMSEVFEWEEEVIRMSSDVRDKYERDIATTATGPDSLPIVLCGDFNNSPESPVYEYMESSFMQKPNLEGIQETFRSAYAGYRKNALATPGHHLEKPSGALETVPVPSRKDEPPHTTVNFRRCWTIDYIWYSKSNLVPSRVLDIPSETVLRSEEGPPDWLNRLAMADSYSKSGRLPSGLHGNHNGIPNSAFGSDHVPIMAEFSFLAPLETDDESKQ